MINVLYPICSIRSVYQWNFNPVFEVQRLKKKQLTEETFFLNCANYMYGTQKLDNDF